MFFKCIAINHVDDILPQGILFWKFEQRISFGYELQNIQHGDTAMINNYTYKAMTEMSLEDKRRLVVVLVVAAAAAAAAAAVVVVVVVVVAAAAAVVVVVVVVVAAAAAAVVVVVVVVIRLGQAPNIFFGQY